MIDLTDLDLEYEVDVVNLVEPSPTKIGRETVAAALIAVTAERGYDHIGQHGMLWDRAVGGGCIQGEMLVKLGFEGLDAAAETSGAHDDVMFLLGYGDSETAWDDQVLASALEMAQQANDIGLPWGACLEAFERVLAGEQRDSVYVLLHEIEDTLIRLRMAHADHSWIDEWTPAPKAKIVATVGNCQTGFRTIEEQRAVYQAAKA